MAPHARKIIDRRTLIAPARPEPAADLPLSPRQLRCLRAVRSRRGGRTLGRNELGGILHASGHAALVVLDELMSRGLVAFAPEGVGARMPLFEPDTIALTPAGRAALREAKQKGAAREC